MSTFHVAPVRSDSGTNLMTRASSTSGLFALEQMEKDDEEPRGLTHVVSDGMLCDKGISEDWESSARIYEYGAAANPDLPAIPVLVHPASLHEAGPTRVIPFDLSSMIGGAAPCTSPNFMASYVRVLVGERISTRALATSQAYYVIRGGGSTTSEHGRVTWNTGDLFVVPKTDGQLVHECSAAEAHDGAALYWIHDQPLLDYLGVAPGGRQNRLGVLLGNAKTEETTKTLTHTLWSLLNSIGPKSVQRPHRHNSVALDLAVHAEWPAGRVYTLMGKEIDGNGDIIDPIKCVWATGAVFDAAGWWHSHHNESDSTAWVLPMQDAGLYTHQRTLDIRFVDDELALHRGGRIRGSARSP
ncbi:hypothetical protein JL722_9545 [Aureococcus anophagefferens]|nr:hypothetical protein JL722_9545 [Aureococcus anophagefferens]